MTRRLAQTARNQQGQNRRNDQIAGWQITVFKGQTVLIIIAVAFTLILTAMRVRKRLAGVDKRIARLRAVMREQSIAVRAQARETLALTRQNAKLEKQLEEMSNQCAEIKSKISSAEQVDRRIYVLDDRKTPADQSWVILVMHPNYKLHISPDATAELSMAWSFGRRFVVWAVDKDRAVDKLHARMPKERGFVIKGIASIDDKEP